jgi:hypothetical protein
VDERFTKIGPIPCPYAEGMRCPLCFQPFKKDRIGKIDVMWIWIGWDGKLYCSKLHAKIGAP